MQANDYHQIMAAIALEKLSIYISFVSQLDCGLYAISAKLRKADETILAISQI